tara:strand:- start:1421 stop:1966 length:546 start_codon:yes stop_codon:yes gene_type:complete
MKISSKKIKDFEILPIDQSKDSDMWNILEIRNLKEVRSQMFNQEIITSENHQKWWSSKSKTCRSIEQLFIVRKNKSAIGMFRFWFDKKHNAGNWTMFRDIRINSSLSGIFMEYFAIEYFFCSELNKNDELIAEVRKGNNIEKLHKKIGFIEFYNDTNWILMKITKLRFDSFKLRFQNILAI